MHTQDDYRTIDTLATRAKHNFYKVTKAFYHLVYIYWYHASALLNSMSELHTLTKGADVSSGHESLPPAC